MQILPHLNKRGSVYQWRRRWRRQSTGIVDIKLSLGTTNLSTALILSRRISVESDIVLENLIDKQISAEDGRKWLANVVQSERKRIEKLKMLRRFDSLDPEDDQRHDDAANVAWQHIAANGVNTPVPIKENNGSLIEQNRNIFCADLASEARRNIVTRDFRTLTGRGQLSTFEIITLMNLLIDGKAAAWNQHNDALKPLRATADQLSESEPGFMGTEPGEPTATCVSMSAFDAPHSTHTTLTAPALTAQLPIPDPQDDTTVQIEVPEFDCVIASIVQRMNAVKRDEKIEEKNLRQYESFAHLFTMLTRITDIRQLRQHHVNTFRADLTKLPKNWGKSPKDRNASREQIMARASDLPADKVGLSVGTVNRHLEHLGQIVEWARDDGIPIDPRLNPTKLRKKDKVRDRDKKAAFTAQQLRCLFKSPVWTGSESERFQTRSGTIVYKNGTYWCPIIAAYTGARREEIAGLAISNIVEVDGIPCFSIEDSELRRIKNMSSKRLVPIHDRLIDLGFLDHVKRMGSTNRSDLFPNLREPKSGKHGRKMGRRMRQIVDESIGVEGADLSFNSFRHFVQNALEVFPDISEKVVRDLVGHEGIDVHQRNYSKATSVEILWDAIHKLPVVI